MRERPVGILVNALREIGAKISYPSKKGFPPLQIKGTQLSGGFLSLESHVSSQFISSLMMIGPSLKDGLKMMLKGNAVSFPYIKLTAMLMQQFGVDVEVTHKTIEIPQADYEMTQFLVEPDWSSASYWYEIAALSNDVAYHLPGFLENSLQGDLYVAHLFSKLGVKTKFNPYGIVITTGNPVEDEVQVDLRAYPDLVPAFLATCAAKSVRAEVSGIDHLKHKESDRIMALARELGKTGSGLRYDDGVLKLDPGRSTSQKQLSFETYGDHRIAMCLAPLALQYESIILEDPRVVNKSYPGFWHDLVQSGQFVVDKI
jgi:3-phosphoshikimate 1-carboxyvinyltransferase